MRSVILSLSLCLPLAACSATDYATEGELDEIAARLEVGDTEGAGAIEDTIIERAVSGTVAMLAPFVPAPVAPFLGLFGALFFRRPRRIVAKALKGVGAATKNVATLKPGAALTDIGESIEDVLRLVGLKDSRPDAGEEEGQDVPPPPTGA